MRKGQVVLLLDALVFGGIGIYALFFPIELASLVGISLHAPAAITDIRATYGGFDIGIAVFFIRAACFNQTGVLHQALWAAALSISGFALARAIGLLVDGHSEAITWTLFFIETVAAVINWAFVLKTRTEAKPTNGSVNKSV